MRLCGREILVTLQPNGARIKELRRSRRLSQEAVAALSRELPPPHGSVSDRTLRTAERGTARISHGQLCAIAAVLEVSLEEIVLLDVSVEPFRGLSAYRFEDAPLFAGRDFFAERGASLLREHGTAAVLGPSGSGKSSLCNAGIAPLLVGREDGRILISCRPSAQTFCGLDGELAPILAASTKPVDLAEARKSAREVLAASPHGLSDLLAAAQKSQNSRPALIHLDQAEELLQYPENAKLLFQHLARAVDGADAALLLSARSDLYGALTQLDGDFFSRFDSSIVMMRPMTEEELRAAITTPLRETDTPFEPALIDVILSDAKVQDGYLSHIQFVLRRMWTSTLPTGERLTVERYFKLGRIASVISRHASLLYRSFSRDDQKRLRIALPRLVLTGWGDRDVAQAHPLSSFPEETRKILRRLTDEDTRILAIDDDGRVGFAHEEIIRQWPELRGWLDEDMVDLRLRDRLEHEIAEWNASGKHIDYLVPPGRKLRSYRALLGRLPKEGWPKNVEEFLLASARTLYGPVLRIAGALAVAVIGVGAWVGAEPARRTLDAWTMTRLETQLDELAKQRDVAYVSDPRMMFPDWPDDTRLGGFTDYRDYMEGFYELSKTSALVRRYFGLCPNLQRRDFSMHGFREIPFDQYFEKCGEELIRNARFDFAVFSNSDFPDGIALQDSSFIGSYLRLVDFADARLTRSNFSCAVIHGADFSRTRELDPRLIEDAVCLFASDGPPNLPPGIEMPRGCLWVEAEDDAERERLQREAFLGYFSCTERERAYRLSDMAHDRMVEGNFDAARGALEEAKEFLPNAYIEMRKEHLKGLTGEMADYTAYAPLELQRVGSLLDRLKHDLIDYRSAGYDTDDMRLALSDAVVERE